MAWPSPVTSTESLVRNTLALCQTAREAGLAVTPAREIDIFRALKSIDWHDVDDYRLLLRTNLASGRADEILFDRVFNTYWLEPAEADSGDYILARSEMIRGSLDVGRSREGHRDMLTEAESFAGEEITRNPNLIMRWDSDAPPLEKVIRELARRLAAHDMLEVLQFPSNLLDPNESLRRLAVEHGAGTQVRGVMAEGRLSGKYLEQAPQWPADDRRSQGAKDFGAVAPLARAVPAGWTMDQLAVRSALDAC